MLTTLWEFRGSLQALFVIALTIMAWRRGAAPERATALVLTAMVTTAWLYRYLAMPLQPGRIIGGYSETDLVYVLIDGTAFVALLAIAMLAKRMYPLWMAGFQLTALAMHFVNEIARTQAPFAYALLNILPFYFMIASQMLGLWLHIRREKRWGPYPNWRSIFDPLPATRRN